MEIGRLLQEYFAEQDQEDHIFNIINHLNIGADLVSSDQEKTTLAELNLLAGKKARLATAYEAGLGYMSAGITILGNSSWQNQYTLTLDLYNRATECAVLSGQFSVMERLSDNVMAHAKTINDTIRILEIKMLAYTTQLQYQKAITLGLETLQKLGLELIEYASQEEVRDKLNQVLNLLGEQEVDTLINKPDIQDEIIGNQLKILVQLFPPTFFSNPELCIVTTCQSVSIAVRYGNADSAPFVYGMLGLIFSNPSIGQYEMSRFVGSVALGMLEQRKTNSFKTIVINVLYGFAYHYTEPLKNCLPALIKGFNIGVENGELSYAAYCVCNYIKSHYATGARLSEVIEEGDQYIAFIKKVKDQSALDAVLGTYAAIRYINNPENNSFNPENLDIPETEAKKWVPGRDNVQLYLYHQTLQSLAFLFGDYTIAGKFSNEARKYVAFFGGWNPTPQFYFYDTLISLKLIEREEQTLQKSALLDRVSENLVLISQWAELAPMNYSHMLHLVQAEQIKIGNAPENASSYYEKAINTAKENGFIQDLALSYELAADFYNKNGFEKIFVLYIQEACNAYHEWEAWAKVNELQKRYPQWLTPQSEIQKQDVPSPTGQEAFDLNAVMKASQAFAGEIVLDRLLAKIMRIVIETAGAQKGFLVFEKEGEWVIEAEGDIDQTEMHVRQSAGIKSSHALASGIIYYVANTRESVVLNDATNEGDFTTDAYIKKHQLKSLLCIPLLNLRKVSGILYLENNLATGAFTKDRVELLNLLSSQMAMALDNAHLYANLERRVTQRTTELEREVKVRQQTEEKLRNILEKLPVAIGMVNDKGEFYFRNNQFIDLFGYSYEDVPTLEKWWVTAYPDEDYRKWVMDTWKEAIEQSAETGGRIQVIEYQVTCADGKKRDIEIGGIMLGTNFLTTLIDNTERNQVKEALKEAKDKAESANQAKSTFLATMSHELRTPLNAVLGFCEVMRQNPETAPSSHEYLQIIQQSGNHLLTLINNVLDMSKIEARQMALATEPVDLNQLVHDVIDMMQIRAEDQALELILAQSSHVPRFVTTDPGHLRQILINLAGNAIKFTEAGQVTLRLTASRGDADPVLVQIVVEDTGVGMAQDDLERIFQPFEQLPQGATQQGTGLGLALTKQFVELLGGTIAVTSTLGVGSRFSVDLPMPRSHESVLVSSASSQRSPAGLEPGQPEYRLLIVEDQLTNRLLLTHLLGKLGFNLREAQNGQEAIEVFQTWQPHLILTDRRMPVMDGLTATRHIRRLPRGDKVKIIALTASAFQMEREELLEAGSDDFLCKPYQAEEIYGCLAKHLGVRYIYADSEKVSPTPNRPASG